MLTINNLSLQYGSKHIFRDVSAQIHADDRIGLAGVNGTNTKRVANKLGIPTIPGTSAPIYNEMEAEEIAQHLFDLQKKHQT
ncbi:MAG: hypothetical protein D3913_16520, partial [Candidatus Electrothrix sp. LOE1_4_5]|nr:hypothetical protein [Candidatus Electrothrix gigas]